MWNAASYLPGFTKEIDVTYIAAMLTVAGYSINEAVVVFAQIRENMKERKPQTTVKLRTLVSDSLYSVSLKSFVTLATVVSVALLFKLWTEPIQAFSTSSFYGLLAASWLTPLPQGPPSTG